MSLRILAVSALAATGLGVVPAHAGPGVRPCPPGKYGVVVVDDNGNLAEVCVRDTEIQAVLDEVRDAVDPITGCPTRPPEFLACLLGG